MQPTTHEEKTKQQVAKILKTSHLSPIMKEFGLFIGIFVSVFIISIVFVNINLFYHAVKGVFNKAQAAEYTFSSEQIKNVINNSNDIETFMKQNNQDAALQAVKEEHTLFVSSYEKTEATLKNTDYKFTYSLIPPENRIFIPAIGVDAPIVDIDVASEEKLKHGDFNQELFEGVVKYPSTPAPGHKGNTLIFGHTSYYRWKKNPYGEIFAKMFDLKKGDQIKVAWNGQLYTYEVVDTIITTPADVDKKYMQYTDDEYITLMGCYPVGSDSRRGLVVAKRVKTADTKITPSLQLQ